VTPRGEEILNYLKARQKDLIDLTKRLVSIESPSLETHTHGPALAILADALADQGYAVRRLGKSEDGEHLYARPINPKKYQAFQILIGHIDTVWPVGTLDNMPIENESGQLRGPGVYDMKAGLVQMVFAITALRDLGLTPNVTPLVFVNSDEEIGSHGSRHYIERFARHADRAFVLEPSLGEHGHIKTARKGVGRYTIRAKGKAAHAGLDPEAGASAILELSHQIQHLFALNDPDAGISVNVGTIDGGLRPNVIAPESSAVIDVRVPTREAATRVHDAIHALKPATPGVQLEISGAIGRPPMEQGEAGAAVWRVAKSAAVELDLELEHGMAGGGSDGNTTSQYTGTLDGLGAVGDGAHAHHEFIFVDKLAERSALLALLLLAPPMSNNA